MGYIADPRWRECNPVTISAGALCSGVLRGVPVRDGADPPLLQKWPRAVGWDQIMRNGGSGGSGDGAVSVGAVCCCRLVGRPGWSLLSAAKPVLFEHSPYLISVGQAYGIVVLSRCLGAAWFAILIALLSILFRQTVLTTFSGIAVSILPHLIGGSFLKYVLPLPAGLLAGTGYVWGTLTEVGYDEDWNLIDIVTFPGITPEQFGFLIVLFLAIVCLLVWLCLRFYVGRRKAISARPLLTAVLILCMTVSLTGCGHSNSSEITHDFLADASKGENRAYTVELDMVENTITATSKATGEAILLTRDPFGQSGAISSIYVDEDACYYASSGEVGDGFQIYRIDLKDFSTRLYFSTGSDNMATFWGLFDHEPTVDELLADVGSVTSFVVDGNYIYYLQGGRLYKVFRWTGWETVEVTNTSCVQNLKCQNGKIICKG